MKVWDPQIPYPSSGCSELSSDPVRAADIKLAVREAGGFVYLIAVRRNPTVTGPSQVQFKGLPAGITGGTVLGHGASNPPIQFSVESGAFTDLHAFAPYNSRVYKFPVA